MSQNIDLKAYLNQTSMYMYWILAAHGLLILANTFDVSLTLGLILNRKNINNFFYVIFVLLEDQELPEDFSEEVFKKKKIPLCLSIWTITP